MTSPAKLISPLASVWPGLEKTINKAFAGPEPSPTPTINFPAPTTSIPAKIPATKPGGRRGLQESFLSGVVGGTAARSLPGQGGGWWGNGSGGSRGGKSLVGQ